MKDPINSCKSAAFAVLLAVVAGCNGSPRVENVSVSLKKSEIFRYPTVGGDEEGARISIQASHYSISEFRRDAETNWIATYVYQPAAGFVGTDHAEIEIFTGSDGATPPADRRKIAFRFVVHD